MSINSMTSDFTKKYVEVENDNRFQILARDLASEVALGTGTSVTEADVLQSEAFVTTAETDPEQSGKASDAFEALTGYIPVETLTLYLGASTSLAALEIYYPTLTETNVFVIFLVLTPILVLLLSWVKRKENKHPVLGRYSDLNDWREKVGEVLRVIPFFRMIASVLAFYVWALAVPANPILQGEAAAIAVSFGALLLSTLLKVVEPLLEVGARPRPYS